MVPRSLVLALALACAVPGPSAAAELAPVLGTTGLGLEARVPLVPRLAARLVGSVGHVAVPRTIRGTRFDVGLDLGGVAAMVDYAPADAGLYLTGGVMRGALGFAAYRDDVSYQLTEGGTEYTGEVGFEGSPRRKIAPVLGLGWRSAPTAGRWRWGIEGGVILTGAWRGSVRADTQTPMLGGLAERFRTELAEANVTLNDRLADLPAVPYLRLAAEWRF